MSAFEVAKSLSLSGLVFVASPLRRHGCAEGDSRQGMFLDIGRVILMEQVENHVATLSLHRPERGNSITPTMAEEIIV